VALLTNETVADAVPETCGVNVSVNGMLCPEASVRGRAIPLSENSGLVTLAEDTVTLEPLAVSVAL